MKVAIIGTGYVGLTTAVTLAYIGHEVYAIDRDREKIQLLQNGQSPIYEPGMSEILPELRRNLTFSTDITAAIPESEVIIIAVGTPPGPGGEVDTNQLFSVLNDIADNMRPGYTYTVAVKSTVPVGTNRQVKEVLEARLAARACSAVVWTVSNPEFLREGMALYDSFYPDRIVVGTNDQEAACLMRELYTPILQRAFKPPFGTEHPDERGLPVYLATDPNSAEMIKYASNAFLALKISFINEVAGLCDRVGADVLEVSRGIGLDSRIGPKFLGPGLGWGGSCFPKDTAGLLAIAAKHNWDMPIIKAARQINERQRILVAEKLETILDGLTNRTIGVLGLTFKPNTDDIRESPAIALIQVLLSRGARIKATDPIGLKKAEELFSGQRVLLLPDPYLTAKDADALVLATEWECYRQLNLVQISRSMRTPVFFDARNIYDPHIVRQAGMTYLGIGRR